VQNFTVDLQVLKHEPNYLLGTLLEPPNPDSGRAAVISHIEFGWIRQCCPDLWNGRPPESLGPNEQSSVTYYLNAQFGL